MMLVFEKDDYKLIFTTEKELTESQTEDVLHHMNKAISELTSNDIPAKENTTELIKPKVELPKSAPVTPERPAFRDRLPNNVVDVKELTITQAVTENALVRCPECGQAHAIVVKSGNTMHLMRKDYVKNEFITISHIDASDASALAGVCCKEDTDRLDYFIDLQGFNELESEDFAVNNETEILCPVCNKSNTFIHWKEAFDMPLSRFETEHLCDACGGEVVEKLVKGKACTHCEKCGLEQTITTK